MKLKNIFSKISLSVLLIAGASNASAAVWTATRNWTMADEEGFAQFIKTLPLDFFETDPVFKDIPTDCADAAYTLRTIYAYQNNLPVSYTSDNGTLTNATTQFDGIQDPMKRLRKFIGYTNLVTSTWSLSRDTYPVQINRKAVKPGTMFLHALGGSDVPLIYRSGHVYYVKDIPRSGIVTLVSSTVPAKVRSLNLHYGLIFAPMEKLGGYRNWKWPNTANQPFESEEQFQFAKWEPKSYTNGVMWNNWVAAIEERLRIPGATASLKERLDGSKYNLDHAIHEKAKAVNEGWAVYNLDYPQGGCMNDNDYDNYSTPTRDTKLQSVFVNFRAYTYMKLGISRGQRKQPAARKKLQAEFAKITYDVGIGRTINLNDVQKSLEVDYLQISEPEHTPEQRWGLQSLNQNEWPCQKRRKEYRN